MSTYPLEKLIPDATMASVCFLLPPGSQMIYLGAKKKFSFYIVCVYAMYACHAMSSPPPQVPLSPLSDPMLSCLSFFFLFFILVSRVGLATVKTEFLPYF